MSAGLGQEGREPPSQGRSEGEEGEGAKGEEKEGRGGRWQRGRGALPLRGVGAASSWGPQRCPLPDPEPFQPPCSVQTSVQACKVQSRVSFWSRVAWWRVGSSSHGKVPGRPGSQETSGGCAQGRGHWCPRSSWVMACPGSPLSKFKCFTCGDCACVCACQGECTQESLGGWQSAPAGRAVGGTPERPTGSL